ncbi:hypothetical protein BDW22DRAFT_1359076 [Trametopsis cervina]|nr:hypothetical protein BDW22DRAFT_1359076 [Trametopsis cervina]
MDTATFARRIPALVVSKPATVFTTAATALSFFALTPTPPLLLVIGLLTVLRLSAWTFVPRQHGYVKGGVQAIFISIAAGAAHLAPSMQALSTPNVALVVFSAISLIASSFAVGVVFFSVRAGRLSTSQWAQLTVFPALWASAWGFTSHVSPVGQLVTWSPVLGLGPYEWTRQVMGQWAIDWIAAAWAVVASEVLGNMVVGGSGAQAATIDDVEPLIDHDDTHDHRDYPHSLSKPSPTALSRSRSLASLTVLLLLLMVPTYFTASLPAPLNSEHTTPFGVACALPDPHSARDGKLTLRHYINATQVLQNKANIVLWPESAVRFDSSKERDAAFALIQNLTHAGNKYIGVSFEEFVPQEGKYRNGFVLLPGLTGPPVFEYYKRNLVPIAESFSLVPGHEAPGMFNMTLGKRTKVRPIPITASICLDFASSSSFTALESRPALILAPARTWHIGVGLAMWEQAKARAAETGSTVVWCDGGEGGISGIANAAYSEIVQVGPGLWDKQIGLPFPFDERRTVFTWGGSALAFLIVWLTTGTGFAVEGVVRRAVRSSVVGSVAGLIAKILPKKVNRATPNEETSLLG